jgi:hypothetical protein
MGLDNLTAAAAGRTDSFAAAGAHPAAVAGVTIDIPWNFHGNLSPPGRVYKIYLQVKTAVTSGLNCTPSPAGIPEAEQILEYISKGPEYVAKIPKTGKS